MASDRFKNFQRLAKEGFSNEDAFINSSDDPEKTKERLDNANKDKEKK